MRADIKEKIYNLNTAIVLHHNDGDGRLSAAITLHALLKHTKIKQSNIKFKECAYVAEYNFVEMVKGIDLVIITDYSIEPDAVKAIMATGTVVILLDHHESAYNKYRDFKEPYLGIIEYESNILKARSGCELTYNYLMDNKGLFSEAISLIGEFDTWRHEKTGNLKALYLKYETEFYTVEEWYEFITLDYRNGENLMGILSSGQSIYKYTIEKYKMLVKRNAYETKIKGFEQYSCLAINTTEFSSLVFGEKMSEYDICAVYTFNGKTYSQSIYSRKVNVQEIASSFSGGGHPGAAGFSTKQLNF